MSLQRRPIAAAQVPRDARLPWPALGVGLFFAHEPTMVATSNQHFRLVRGLLGPAGHLAWTGSTAAARWAASAVRGSRVASAVRRSPRAVGRFVLTFLAAGARTPPGTAWARCPGTP